MLFDPRPKESRSELFDREKELESLSYFVKSGSPLILCIGIRRIGKTSLIKVFLNENNYPYIYINARRLAEYQYSIRGLYTLLAESIASSRFSNKLLDYLKGLRGVKATILHGVISIEFNWKRREPSITSLLEKLNNYGRDRNTFSSL